MNTQAMFELSSFWQNGVHYLFRKKYRKYLCGAFHFSVRDDLPESSVAFRNLGEYSVLPVLKITPFSSFSDSQIHVALVKTSKRLHPPVCKLEQGEGGGSNRTSHVR